MKRFKGTWLPDEDTYFERHLDELGGFQTDHLHTALRHTPRRGLAVDIGAHVGTMTRILAREFTTVVALEPDLDSFMCLLKNTESWANVTTIRAALGAHAGACRVYRDLTRPGNTGAHFLVPTPDGGALMDTLDHLLPRLSLREPLDFVKIDVEGMEDDVLVGAADSFLKHRPTIMMEVKDLGRSGDYLAADRRLKAMGATPVDRVGKDVIYRWSDR